MKRLYLASSIDLTAGNIAKDIGKDPKRLKLVFISTAAEPESGDKQWLIDDRGGLEKAGFNISDYTLTGKTPKDIEEDLVNFDVIHVNGGDSFYLLLQARKSGFDRWIREKVDSGEKIYIGSSAGSIVCAPDTMNASFFENFGYFKKLKTYEGFGLVNFMVFPHWGSEFFRDKYLSHRMKIAYKPENKIILLNDWQYVKIVGGTYKIVDIRDKN